MTKFSDMTATSRNGWLAWCNSHDWSQGPQSAPWYDDMTGELVTYCSEVTDGFICTIVEARHTTPRDLKAWAGY